jgi:uncharacterized protein
MSYRDDRVTLRQMLEHAQRALVLVTGDESATPERRVLADMALQQVVSMLGDAARRISSQTRNHGLGIDWDELTEHGERLRSDYAKVDISALREDVLGRFPSVIERLFAAVTEAESADPAPRPLTVGSRIKVPQERIAELCRRNRIRKLAFFGSVLREDFSPESDVDVLVEFEPGQTPGLAFYGIEEELSELLGRQADLNTPNDLSPYFRDQVLAEAESLFVAV